MRIRRWAPLLVTGALATLAPTLMPARASAADPLHRFHHQRPEWHRCGATMPAAYRCATLKVPLDYRRPTGKTIDLAVSRMKTSTPGKRHGVMLFNPGGPGMPGALMPMVMADTMPETVRERYDLIGFDPRGVGRSTPLSCGLTTAEQSIKRPYHPGTFQKDVAWARSIAGKCRAHHGDDLRHFTTRNTARDMDVLRAVLGEKKISYLGTSYGTYLGAVYTQLFPERTDRFVLDSAVDPARIWRGMFQSWAKGAEEAFPRWARWTARHDATYHLGTTPAAVRKTFWDLVARADRKPVPHNGDTLNGDGIRATMQPLFVTPEFAAETVADLHKAAAGSGKPAKDTAPAEGAEPADGAGDSGPGDDAPADNSPAAFWSLACGDTAWPRDPAQYRRDAARDKRAYPLYGDFTSNITPCAFWAEPAEPATTVNNTTGVLTVQNQWDSQTPLASGLGMHRALKGSRMLYVAGGEGHGVYKKDPRTCADRTINAYLTTGQLPPHDLTCKVSGAPAEGTTPAH
ncbi:MULTISPECIES: alpha/beta fold hydrolase [Streptomyces]|uniref:Alpha/beta fold hydrolase n=1 Tax=Streptomyces ramulosus TaxID=47762 RepID=A0ABW1FEE8_9ACTN